MEGRGNAGILYFKPKNVQYSDYQRVCVFLIYLYRRFQVLKEETINAFVIVKPLGRRIILFEWILNYYGDIELLL